MEFGVGLKVMNWLFNNEVIFHYFQGYTEYPLGKTKYSVNATGRHFNILIKDVTLDNGGTYTCSIISEVRSANLLVYGE